MLAAWPGFFPLPKLATYQTSNDNAVLRSQMEGGPARQRRVFTQVPAQYRATFIFDNVSYTAFRGFWKFTLNEGADFFEIQLDLDIGLTTESARFIQPYTARKISNSHWSVDGILEVEDPTIVSEELLELIIELGETAVEDLQEIAQDLTDLETLQAALTAL